MIVTLVQKLSNNRYRIYTDGRVFCVLYKQELAAYNIAEGAELSEETIEAIRTEVLALRAKKRAMNLLMKHSFTEHKLREKLIAGDYPDDIIDEAIDYVVGYGYVDDRAFARDYITSHNRDKSVRRIYTDLMSKGVSSDIIKEVMQELDGTQDAVDEEEQIRRLLNKRHFDPENAEPSDIRREMSYLAGRGFGADTIRRVIRHIPDELL